MGNLVKATLVSKEFWDEISGDIEEECDFRVGTADKDGEGLKVKGKRIQVFPGRNFGNISC